MKVWELAVCLFGEDEKLFDEYFGDVDTVKNGRNDIEHDLVKKILNQCEREYYLTSHGHMRLWPESEKAMKERNIEVAEVISILEAFERYGGGPIAEVVDKGSYKVDRV